MAKTKKEVKEKEHVITTKHKLDNSVEVQIKKSPGKTKFGKVVAWLIIAGTILVPLAGLIYLLIQL